jgi:STE24 endopeptidase
VSAGVWLRDYCKIAALGVVIGAAAAELVYFAIRLWPRYGWMAATASLVGVNAAVTCAAPVLILPLFHRSRPLGRNALRQRLLRLSERAGIAVLDVYEWGLGEKTRRASAALVGAGATRRILLSDTLLADFTDDEIEVVLAHEMGHHLHGDVLKGLAAEFVVLLGGFSVAAIALDGLWKPLGLASPADVAGLPIVLLATGGVSLLATPLLNAQSRRNERRADRYALELTARPDAFVAAMRRMAAQNLADEDPSRAAFWLFHTHPRVRERVERAQSFILNP